MEKVATQENKKRNNKVLQDELEKQLESEIESTILRAPKKPKLQKSDIFIAPVHFDFGKKKVPLLLEQYKETVDDVAHEALTSEEEEEEETEDTEEITSDEEESEEEEDTNWKKKKLVFREKETLSPEDRINCSYSYGVNKHGHVYRILRDAFGIIINRSYQLLKGLHLDAISEKCFGVKKGRKWEARRTLSTGEFVTNTFKYLDE